MTKTYIHAIGKANPPLKIPQSQAIHFMSRVLNLDPQQTRKIKALHRASKIEYRHTVLEDHIRPPQEAFVFYPNQNCGFPSTAQRMELYKAHACPLAIKAIEDCLVHLSKVQKSSLQPRTVLSSVTHLITFSCTGMYAPGLDIELVEKLGLSTQVQRTCINFMGCYAAFNALKTAHAICQSDAQAQVLIVGVELCTLHFQNSTELDDLISSSIFGDGAAAAIISAETPNHKALSLEAFHCDLAPQGKQEMAWHIRDFGFEMRLSSYVPDLLKNSIYALTQTLLDKLHLQLAEIDYFAIHPGGRRILESIEQALALPPCSNVHAYEVLKNYGNMSSVTVLFVLLNILQISQVKPEPQRILSMAFGPGLTLESALLNIHTP